MSFPMERYNTLAAVLKGWVGKDAQVAEEWVANFNSPLKQAARHGLVMGVADTDPKRAFALLEGSSDPRLVDSIFRDWVEHDPRMRRHTRRNCPPDIFATLL